MSSEIWDVQVICDIHKGLADIVQDTDRGIIMDWQLEAKQDICRTFQMALNIYSEGGEKLAQVAQRGGRCPIPGNIQGQVGRGSEQPDLVGNVSAHGMGVGLDGL